jgi:ribonuclease HI
VAELFAYTDGACSGNPGPGGWGVVLEAWDGGALIKARDLGGGEALTTNNRMEMMAAIAALEALERPSAITVVTDSTYLKDGITRWIHGWKKNGWKNAAKTGPPPGEMGMDQGPCRPRAERARRCVGPGRDQGAEAGGAG